MDRHGKEMVQVPQSSDATSHCSTGQREGDKYHAEDTKSFEKVRESPEMTHDVNLVSIPLRYEPILDFACDCTVCLVPVRG